MLLFNEDYATLLKMLISNILAPNKGYLSSI